MALHACPAQREKMEVLRSPKQFVTVIIVVIITIDIITIMITFVLALS